MYAEKPEDPLSLEQTLSMTGLEYMQGVLDGRLYATGSTTCIILTPGG